jgi:hypothetical protein
MRKVLLLVIIILANKVNGQKIELNIQAYGGLFHYSGGTTSAESAINLASINGQNSSNNPFGSNNAYSYGFGAQATVVKKSGLLYGLKAGYEVLRSSLNINGLYFNYYNYEPGTAVYDINRVNQIDANGQTILTNNQIVINPFVGYRIKIKKIKIDLMAGLDFGFNLMGVETDQAIDVTGKSYITSFKINNIPADIRIKFGTALSYRRYGLTTGFSQGLTNLNRNVANNSANSEFLQLGISYKLL